MSPAGRAGCGRGARRTPALLLLLALIAHGCAPATVPPSPPRPLPSKRPTTAKARPLPGYESRTDDFAAVDTTALRGRRIALDPGHGGEFRGALGVNGLTEAEVNLGVAHHLRGLLEARGAIVFMTRTDDRDFLTPADSSLRSDLAERTRIANAFHPELFVSIHHNADARGAHDVNETQTYYKLGDEGPSLDAAQSVHRYLVRNLGIERHRIMPGNYFVLRNNEAPAILTESSYITNPDVEGKLALAAKQRLEAEALYLGLTHYFARPRPEVEEFVARATLEAPPESLFTDHGAPYQGAPLLTAVISGPYDAAEMTLDGSPLTVTRHGPLLTAQPPELVAGPHVATLRVRLSGSGSARERRLEFRIARSVETIRFTPLGLNAGPEGGLVPVRAEVLDSKGLPLRDSMWVRFVADGRGVLPRDTLALARDGVAWTYFRVAPKTWPARIRARIGTKLPAADHDAIVWSLGRLKPRPHNLALGFALRMPEGVPLTNAPGTREPRPPDAWLNRDGFAVCPRDSAGFIRVPRLAGYRLWPSEIPWPPRFTAIAGGALHGRRIVLDPDGGGDQEGGTGKNGTRGANLNLDVARALAGLLEAAGAEVRVTRGGDFALSDVERVQISEAFRADRFVRIGHRAERPMIGYYFSSAVGRRWAERTARTLAALKLGSPEVAEDAQYPLQQTSCPALYVSPARVDDPASEERLSGPGGVRAEAYAIYLALIGEWNDAVLPLDSLTVRDAADRPVAGAVVTLGLSTLLQTGPNGVVRFARTEPGPIVVEATHPRVHARRVLLDSESGMILTGPETH